MAPRRKLIARKTDESYGLPTQRRMPTAVLRPYRSTNIDGLTSPPISLTRLAKHSRRSSTQSVHLTSSAFQGLVLELARLFRTDDELKLDEGAIKTLKLTAETYVDILFDGNYYSLQTISN
jgi:hypothetical protein